MRQVRTIVPENRPARPLVVFDGDCGFCRQWVSRWRRMTGDAVQYRPYQEVAGLFPEIGEADFKARVWLIEPDGTARGGAGAVFGLYRRAGRSRWPAWMHDRSAGFACAAESAYDLVSRNRDAASAAVGWLWGTIDRRPTYRRSRSIFLRALGAVYVVAFWSFAVQVDGLIGGRGIAPAADFIRLAGDVLGAERFHRVPTLLWFDASDRALHALCWGGVVAGLFVVAGVLPGPLLVLLWAAYLSLVSVGQPFLGYQWDVLLLEAGLLAILLAPWGLLLDRSRRDPSPIALWLVRWLVFRLMFLSGIVKFTSHDPTWASWRALDFHYETQPIPTWTSWYVHQMPGWFHRASVGFMLWAELVAPFLVFGPRRVRMVGFASIVGLQILIASTGNYGFFNLLSIVLCLILVEDRDWGVPAEEGPEPARRAWFREGLIGAAGAVIVAVTTMEAVDRCRLNIPFPRSLEGVRGWVDPFHSMNAYGLFAVMTTERPEIILEGSRDGETWTPYNFPWKPGDPARPPRFATPHMPRLDWQMWFAALGGDCRTQPWFLAFEKRLLEGSPDVIRLLADNPFPDAPPRFLRARMYLYRFTRRGEAAWWTREEVGSFCPPVEL